MPKQEPFSVARTYRVSAQTGTQPSWIKIETSDDMLDHTVMSGMGAITIPKIAMRPIAELLLQLAEEWEAT